MGHVGPPAPGVSIKLAAVPEMNYSTKVSDDNPLAKGEVRWFAREGICEKAVCYIMFPFTSGLIVHYVQMKSRKRMDHCNRRGSARHENCIPK